MSKNFTNIEAFRRLGEALDSLEDAYWDATTIETKDQIRGAARVLLKEYQELARKGLANNSNTYKEITGDLNAAKKKITKLKDQIEDLIEVVGVAARVVETLGLVLELI